MRKLLLTAFSLLLCIMATAQTNFRAMTYDEALAAAKSENKLVFMDYYTDWCGPCKMMAREVFPQKGMGEYMNSHFVCIKVNAEKGEGVELAKTYQIKAYPTFIVIDADKKEIGRTVGYHAADAMTSELDMMIDPTKKPELLQQRYDKGERTPDLIKSYANYKIDQLSNGGRMTQEEYEEKYKGIVKIVDDYFANLSDADRLKSDNKFIYMNYTSSPFDAPARFMVANRDKFAAADKADLDSITRQLYNRELLGLLSGTSKYDAANYETLKKEIKKYGLDKENKNEAMYKFIEVEAKGDKKAYIDFCDKNLNTLTPNQCGYMLEMYASHFKDSDEATKKAASQFLRNHIGSQPCDVMSFTVMQIAELEGRGH